MKDKIDKTIKLLNEKLNLINKDYEIVSKANKKLNKSSKVFYHNPDLITETCDILLKNRFDDFLTLQFDIKLLEKVTSYSGKMVTNMFFKNVNIKNGKFKDTQSYAIFMQRLFAPIQRIQFVKIDKDAKLKHEKSLEYNIMQKTQDKFIESLNLFLNKYEKIINKYNKLVNILKKLENVLDDEEKYKKTCEDLFIYLNEEKIDIGVLDNLKDELKKSITPKKETEKISYYDSEDTEFKKEGNREDRIKQHEKLKLKESINYETKKLDDDARQWVNLIVEQLTCFEEQQIKDFNKNPYMYLPEQQEKDFKDIIALSIDKLKYIDANPTIVSTLQKVL